MDATHPTVDPLARDLLSTAEASILLRDRGHNASAQTIWTWITKGRRGVRLPAVRVGNGFKTNEAALRWFLLEVDRRSRDSWGLQHAG